MSVRRMHQLLSGYADGDAISREARTIASAAGRLGWECRIYAPLERTGREMARECLALSAFRPEPEDVVLHHYSIASPAAALFAVCRGRRILRYHNITPAAFFRGFDDAVARQLDAAREALVEAARVADAIWAVSAFNAAELDAAGRGDARVAPLFFDPSDLDVASSAETAARFGGPLHNILFVGRIAPNKCIEELILAFAWLNKAAEPRSRLILAGSERSCPRYFAMLKLLAGRLGLANACFEGFVSEAQLAAYYGAAHVFVCPSRHEGYCLPLVEAMCRGVPVVARDTGGMPEAMDGAGVLFDDAEPRVLAELILRVLKDSTLRGEILASQAQRVARVRARDIEGELRSLLEG